MSEEQVVVAKGGIGSNVVINLGFAIWATVLLVKYSDLSENACGSAYEFTIFVAVLGYFGFLLWFVSTLTSSPVGTFFLGLGWGAFIIWAHILWLDYMEPGEDCHDLFDKKFYGVLIFSHVMFWYAAVMLMVLALALVIIILALLFMSVLR